MAEHPGTKHMFEWFWKPSSIRFQRNNQCVLVSVGQPAWQESSKVKSQSRDFRFIFDEKWRSTLRLKYVGLQ